MRAAQVTHPDLAVRRHVHWPEQMQQGNGQTAGQHAAQQRWIGRKAGPAATRCRRRAACDNATVRHGQNAAWTPILPAIR